MATKAIVNNNGELSGPYGVKAVRHLRSAKYDGVHHPKTDARKTKNIENTYDYFVREVDPLIGDCITYLLCTQPESVPVAMLEFLNNKKNNIVMNYSSPNGKASKSQKLYLATRISPVLTKLVNRIATSRPKDIIDFMSAELTHLREQEIIENQKNKVASVQHQVQVTSAPAAKKSVQSPRKPQTLNEIVLTTANNTVSDIIAESARKSGAKLRKSADASGEPITIHISLFGENNSGKTSYLHIIQGETKHATRPTNGFRPVTMQLNDSTKVKFFDLGGGHKIRDIWKQYYHDCHGIIYVIDSTLAGEALDKSINLFQETIKNSDCQGKPLLVLASKQDLPGALTASQLARLYGISNNSSIRIMECVCASTEPEHVDTRIETSIEWLLTSIQQDFNSLNERVVAAVKRKEAQEIQQRIEKERKVMRNKIACAFPKDVNKSKVDFELPQAPEDTFAPDVGINFLASEVGVEVDSLPNDAKAIAALVGYQRLVLQMVGALNAPISKKKSPMPWSEILQLVLELRRELGL